MDEQHDTGYELFRRAIVERDADAWAEIHACYRLLLISYSRQSSVRLRILELHEDVADRALFRFWSAMNAERFGSFLGIGSILAYLRASVMSELLDMARSEAARERMRQHIVYDSSPTPEELVLERIDNQALWRLVWSAVETPQERAIVELNIMLGQPSRAILEARADLFRSIGEVYRSKRNLMGRLKRSQALQHMLEDALE